MVTAQMIRLFSNNWVISFVVLSVVSFGLIYGILTLLGFDDDEFVVPDISPVGVGSESDIRQPTAPPDAPIAVEQPESPVDSTAESPADLKSDLPDSDLVVADAIETTVATGDWVRRRIHHQPGREINLKIRLFRPKPQLQP